MTTPCTGRVFSTTTTADIVHRKKTTVLLRSTVHRRISVKITTTLHVSTISAHATSTSIGME